MFLRKLSRRRLCMLCCLCLCVVPLVIVSSTVWVMVGPKHRKPCSNDRSKQLIDTMCERYTAGKITGGICPLICTAQTMTIHHCLNHFGGKDVFAMQSEGKEIIMKYQDSSIPEAILILNYEGKNGKNQFPTLTEFKKMVVGAVADSFLESREKNTDEVFAQIIPNELKQYFSNDVDEGQQKAAMQSLWELVTQVEYVSFKYMENMKHITHILSTCGGYYTVESGDSSPYIATGQVHFKFWLSDWDQRARWALGVLQLMEESENNSSEYGVVHHCDLADDNFGVGEDGLARAIDVDAVLTDITLKVRLSESTEHCVKHFDCSIGDCHGACDLENNKCLNIRVNNNIQKLCEEILLTSPGSRFAGLLRYPPKKIAHRLNDVLYRCAYPNPPTNFIPQGCKLKSQGEVECGDSEDDEIKFSADYKFLEEIRGIVTESLREE